MEAGGPGAPTHHAARRVVEGRRREPDSAATQPHLMAGQSVQDLQVTKKAATLKLVQWMEVGDLGVPILHAPRLVVEDIRREPGSVITQPLLMAGQSVQDGPIR